MARHRIRRLVFVGVPRAVLDDRARRGLLTTGDSVVGRPSDLDLQTLYRFQFAARARAD